MAKSRRSRTSVSGRNTPADFASAVEALRSTQNFYTGLGKVPTGVLSFDEIFQGGLPRGKLIEFSSREGVGKSTMMLDVCRALCYQGHNCLYIDAEHGVTESMIDGIAVRPYLDKNFFLLPTAKYAEISDILDDLLPREPTLVVIDSITAMKPSKLDDINVEDVQPGLVSRLQATFLQKYTEFLGKYKVSMVLLNQMRTKINMTGRGQTTEGPAGGNAIRFYCDARFRIRKNETLTVDGNRDSQPWGAEVIIDPIKNRICPWQQVQATIIFGNGVSNVAFIRDRLQDKGLLQQSSSYFKFQTERVTETVQGRQAMMQLIKDNYEYFTSMVATRSDVTDYTPTEEEEQTAAVLDNEDNTGAVPSGLAL